jgi:hypothetical protein
MKLLWMGWFSWFLSHHVHYWYINKLLIFVYWLYILLFCWRCLSDLKVFWCALYGLLSIGLYCLQIMIIWSSFPICIPFISFSCLVALRIQALHQMSGESRHFCLIPDFKGNAFRFSPFSTMLAIGLSYKTSLCWSIFLLFPVSLGCLSWKHIKILSKPFCQRPFLHLLR